MTKRNTQETKHDHVYLATLKTIEKNKKNMTTRKHKYIYIFKNKKKEDIPFQNARAIETCMHQVRKRYRKKENKQHVMNIKHIFKNNKVHQATNKRYEQEH